MIGIGAVAARPVPGQDQGTGPAASIKSQSTSIEGAVPVLILIVVKSIQNRGQLEAARIVTAVAEVLPGIVTGEIEKKIKKKIERKREKKRRKETKKKRELLVLYLKKLRVLRNKKCLSLRK